MNQMMLFKKKSEVYFDYLKTGDIFKLNYRGKKYVFIKGNIYSSEYIECFKHYKIILYIFYYDVTQNKFMETYLKVYSKDVNKIKFFIYGIYRKTILNYDK